MAERVTFQRTNMTAGETFEDYLARLRQVAERCGFPVADLQRGRRDAAYAATAAADGQHQGQWRHPARPAVNGACVLGDAAAGSPVPGRIAGDVGRRRTGAAGVGAATGAGCCAGEAVHGASLGGGARWRVSSTVPLDTFDETAPSGRRRDNQDAGSRTAAVPGRAGRDRRRGGASAASRSGTWGASVGSRLLRCGNAVNMTRAVKDDITVTENSVKLRVW